MKLPDLRRPKLGSGATGSTTRRAGVGLPRGVEDVYRDMRDRRLLLPALGLVIGIVAVPVALSSSREEPPPAAPFVEPEGAEAVAPAVFTEQQIGVRDYRERLGELKSKNPFAGNFTAPGDAADVGAIADPPAAAPPAPEPGTTTPPPASSPPPESSPEGPAGGPLAPTPDEPGSQPPGDVGESGSGDRGPALVLAPRLDVLAGPVGERKRIENAKVGALLPTRRKAPIAMFLGISGDRESAHFAVSGNVTETSGKGNCNPGRRDCEFLKLGVGEKQYFTYGPEAARYSIKVTDIREVVEERREVAPEQAQTP